MAKLNGVKTIDMVNGEITKVSYDGAEYALVKGFGKIGDLVQCNRVHAFFTKGEFYEVTEISEEGEWVHAIDDEYDRYHLDVVKSAKLFRKVSAQTAPTIEKMSESKPELKSGDFVRFEKDRLGITANKIYEIVDNKTYGLGVVDDNDMFDVGHKRGDKYEILSAEEVAKHRESEKWAKIGRKPNEYRKGDIISYEHFHPIAYYIVTRIENDRVYYNCRNHGNSEEFSRKDSKAINLVAPVEVTLN